MFILLPLAIVLLTVRPAVGQDGSAAQRGTPRDYSIEAGVAIGSYPDETAHSEFASLAVSRPFKDTWRFSASHDKRFENSGIGLGAGYSRYWSSGYNISVGLSTGTSEGIHPRYAIGLTGGKNVLPNLLVSVSYLRWQSRIDSRSDGFMVGATWYALAHWIVGGGFRADLGQPGSQWSFSGDFGVTYAVYRNTYIGLGVTFADVAYLPALNPPGASVVEYSASSFRVSASKFINPTMGLSAMFDYSPFWDSTWLTFRFFKDL